MSMEPRKTAVSRNVRIARWREGVLQWEKEKNKCGFKGGKGKTGQRI